MKTFLCILFILTNCQLYSQVQELKPQKLAIFKNGTYFIKKSAEVNVNNKTFSLQAPQKVLMGSFWLSTAANASVKSISVRLDTIKVAMKPEMIEDYYKVLIGKQVSFYDRYINTESITGTLLEYNAKTQVVKIKTNEG